MYCYGPVCTILYVGLLETSPPVSRLTTFLLLLTRGLDTNRRSEGGHKPLCGRGGEGPWGCSSSSLREESDCCGTGTLGHGAQQGAACQSPGTP